jgi:hypothetical protein
MAHICTSALPQAHARKAAAATSEVAAADTARRRADDLTVELAARLEQRRAATAAERARLAADGKRAQHERMQSAAGSAAAEAARFRWAESVCVCVCARGERVFVRGCVGSKVERWVVGCQQWRETNTRGDKSAQLCEGQTDAGDAARARSLCARPIIRRAMSTRSHRLTPFCTHNQPRAAAGRCGRARTAARRSATWSSGGTPSRQTQQRRARR